ncbi:MAG TPA: hypothetical protein DC049_09215 [Spirochaetia bacterium]|nr:hypothetical protein [Spirochaetia bacterium]
MKPNTSLQKETPNSSTSSGIISNPKPLNASGSYDVIVCGSGPAGMGAPLACGVEGLRVLLLEQHGILGGMWTAGLVNPLFEFQKKGWLVDELVETLKNKNALHCSKAGFLTFDFKIMKLVLEELCGKYHV